jgi:hemerythrin superfamily protein
MAEALSSAVLTPAITGVTRLASLKPVKGGTTAAHCRLPCQAKSQQPQRAALVAGREHPKITETSMPSTTPADAIALLKADHRKVEALFEQFEKAKDNAGKQKLAQEICTELTVHATIEEEIFYPACKEAVEDDLEHEAYVEHDGAKVLIAEIAQGNPEDEFYDAKVMVLSEMIKHHVKEEEKPGEGFFAQARKGDVDMEALGGTLQARKEQLLAAIKQGGLPPPETRSFTGHKLKQGHVVEAAG